MGIQHFVYPFISLLTFAFFHFLALQILLLWTSRYKFLCETLFSVIYLGVELLSYMVPVCLTSWATCQLFSRVAFPFYISANTFWGASFPHLLANIWYCLFDYNIPTPIGEVVFKNYVMVMKYIFVFIHFLTYQLLKSLEYPKWWVSFVCYWVDHP